MLTKLKHVVKRLEKIMEYFRVVIFKGNNYTPVCVVMLIIIVLHVKLENSKLNLFHFNSETLNFLTSWDILFFGHRFIIKNKNEKITTMLSFSVANACAYSRALYSLSVNNRRWNSRFLNFIKISFDLRSFVIASSLRCLDQPSSHLYMTIHMYW